MASYQQTLQTQGGVANPVSAPTSTGAIASTLASGLDLASDVLSRQREAEAARKQQAMELEQQTKVDTLASKIYDIQLFGAENSVKASQRMSQIRNDFLQSGGDIGIFNAALERAKILSGTSYVSFAKEEAKEAEQVRIDARDARSRQIEESWSLIPEQYKAQFAKLDESGVITEDEKLRVFTEYQNSLIKASAAEKKKEAGLEAALANQKSSVNSFSRGVNEMLDVQLNQPIRVFFESVSSIDPDAPDSSTVFMNAKIQAREAASLVETNIRLDYSRLIGNLTDADQITLAEKRRDAAIAVIENFVTDIESSTLDQLKNKKSLYDALIVDQQLPVVDAIAQGRVFEARYGGAAPIAFQTALRKMDDEKFGTLTEQAARIIGGAVQASDQRGGFSTDDDFRIGQISMGETIDRMDGVADPTYSDRLAKDFIYSVDYAVRQSADRETMLSLLDNANKPGFDFQIEQLPKRQQEAVRKRYGDLLISVVNDRTEGDVARMNSMRQYEWDAENRQYVVSERFKEETMLNPYGFGSEFLTEFYNEAEEVNERIARAISIIKERNPSISDGDAYRRLGLQ